MHILKAANMVAVVHGLGNLAFCRVGDDAWTDIDTTGAGAYGEDVIYHNGRFYGLSQLAGLFLLCAEEGVDRPWVVERLTEDLEPFGLFYLVPDIFTDNMFMTVREVDHMDIVTDSMSGDAEHMDLEDDEEDPNPPRPRPRPPPHPRQPHRTVHFDIYKTPLGEEAPNKELNKWMKVESLGDRLVFFGYNSSMMIIASEFPGFKGNLIYFADTCVDNYLRSPHGCCDTGVFNVEDNTVLEQLFAEHISSSLSASSMDYNPALFLLAGRILEKQTSLSPNVCMCGSVCLCFPSARALALHSFSFHLPLFLVGALHLLKLQSAAITSSPIQSF